MKIFDDNGTCLPEYAGIIDFISDTISEATAKIMERYPNLAPQDVMWSATNSMQMELLVHHARIVIKERKENIG